MGAIARQVWCMFCKLLFWPLIPEAVQVTQANLMSAYRLQLERYWRSSNWFVRLTGAAAATPTTDGGEQADWRGGSRQIPVE